MKRLLVAFFFLLATATASLAETHVSDFDPGGAIGTYKMWWERWARSGETLVIDAPCISACTLFLSYMGERESSRVCVTPKGSLGFHMAAFQNASMEENAEYTQAIVRAWYPQWVQRWIAANGGLKKAVKFMYPEEMQGHIPMCPGFAVPSVPVEKLIEGQSSPAPQHEPKRLPAPEVESQVSTEK